jgi:hypothetical protein
LGTGSGNFAAAVNYTVQDEPYTPVAADFNGDGHIDIAVNNAWSHNVSVLLGNGDGTLQSPQSFPAGSLAAAVAAGDFNGDHNVDLIVANSFSRDVSVLLGNGNGTFQLAIFSPAGDYPTTLAPGDFNGDGKLDVAVANLYAGTASVLLGNGDGTFQSPVAYPAGSGTYFLNAGDLNGDTYPDLVVSKSWGDSVSILLGVANGTFSPMVSYYVGSTPYGVAIGDLNGDGFPDLAVACWNQGLVVLTGDGTGVFGPPMNFPAGVNPIGIGIMAVDLNGDGKLDLAATASPSDSLRVILNQTPILVASSSATPILCFGDLSTVTVSATGGTPPYDGTGTFQVTAGTYTYTVTDANGCQAVTTITVAPPPPYGFNGFLPPIGGADATGGTAWDSIRTFKLGSTIPFKFIATCNGNPITTGVHTISLQKVSGAIDTGDTVIPGSTDAASTGNQFRLSDGQWHFNVNTKTSDFSAGTWRATATLSDGSTHTAYISLK